MKVDAILVSYNTRGLLMDALHSLREHGGTLLNGVIVVDNASNDGTPEAVRGAFPDVTFVEAGGNIGFGAANNLGLARSAAERVLFMNPDARLTEGALQYLVDCIDSGSHVAVAGPALKYPDGSFQPSCRRFPSVLRNFWCFSGLEARLGTWMPGLSNWLSEEAHSTARAVDMVSGACFLAARACVDAAGGFDENLFMYEEEADLMLPTRRAGCEVRYCPAAVVFHVGGASTENAGRSPFQQRHLFRSKYYLFRKHYGRLRARLAYLSDLAVFSVSRLLARLRGTNSRAPASPAVCRRAWRESFLTIAELRRQNRLFQ